MEEEKNNKNLLQNFIDIKNLTSIRVWIRRSRKTKKRCEKERMRGGKMVVLKYL